MTATKWVRSGVLIFLLLCGIGRIEAQDISVDEASYPKVQRIGLKAIGNNNTFIHSDSAALYLLVFLSPECPLSQNYTLVLNDLQKKFSREVSLHGIIPGRMYSEQVVQQFVKDYTMRFPVWIDLKKELSNYVHASVTPEVVLLNKSGALVYRGAIDDWVQAFGKKKAKAKVHYLEDAIKAYLQNKNVAVKKTSPVGCLINEF
jgi:hypothetical protein